MRQELPSKQWATGESSKAFAIEMRVQLKESFINLKLRLTLVMDKLVLSPGTKPTADVTKRAESFLKGFRTLENESGIPHILLLDERSGAFYIICHINGGVLSKTSDIDAVLDPNETEDYKLNRDIYTDNYAYRKMEFDAINGRSFEDIVIEYDTSYRPSRPLKVFGGQHRILAMTEAVLNGKDLWHGIRVYFNLDRDQRLDIATANNTAIAISNDLVDRMQEEHLGNELRDWCQRVGILEAGQNFADKRSPQGILTVRAARTLVVNYYLGKGSPKENPNLPVVAKSGPGVDDYYVRIRNALSWSDKNLERMGSEFAKLHKLQRQRVLSRQTDNYPEFANKAIHPTVTAAWAFATGYLETHFPDKLANHFGLTDESEDDPLNAAALLGARLKGIDHDTYRGIGSRIDTQELGRTLEVFLLQALETKRRGINARLANAAIKSYEAKKLNASAKKDLEKI